MKTKALVLLSILVMEIVFPLGAYALTGGPSQPEVQSFEPVGTSEMVDVFSGDFNYNIPLLDVNGYPINIAYHAGASMDQEASWVGLGWNINPGTINREVRGLPDDMNGEGITKEINLQDNWTIGLKGRVNVEVFGKDKDPSISPNVGVNLGLKYNRYKGMGYSLGSSVGLRQNIGGFGLNEGLAMDYSDDGGLDISPSVSLASSLGPIQNNFSVGSGVNSRNGLKGLNVNGSITVAGKRATGNISYTRATPAYTPNISTPMAYFSTDFSFKSGTEIYGQTIAGSLNGSFSNQYIPNDKKSQTKKGYGYMYEHEASTSDNPKNRDYLLDFNRENDGSLMRTTPFLPWANHTYDMYSVSAQGVGGSYRLQRNDLSVVHDDFRDSKTTGHRTGVDFAAGNLLKAGLNLGYNYSQSTSGYWSQSNDNLLANQVGFVKDAGVATYEPVYFKDVNELTPQNADFLALVEDTSMVSPQLSGYGLSPILKTDNPSSLQKTLNKSKVDNTSKERATRNKLFTYRKAKEADYCLDKKIKSYAINSQTFEDGKLLVDSFEDRSDDKRKPDHISEIEVLNTDGSRHVFGIPAYNNNQVEKSFRVDVNDADPATGLVGYERGKDNVLHEPYKNAKNAIDEFYSATKTPAYAHSYLLTGVLSPDYIDLTGNGISDDDLGSAVKFNYSKVHSDFGWRAPYQPDKAKHSKGNASDKFDDMGNYIYGEKEIWHVHSIEGKTHIALFKISERQDALGVSNENGDKDTSRKMYELDRIELYSKRELKKFGDDAVPIKTVHFTYNYDLCKGVSNQMTPLTKGKLTLEKIHFTYGSSQKGMQNSYKFHYNDNQAKYHLLAYDRWGTYAPPRTSSLETTNAEYPYTDQSQLNADEYASLWNLNKIELPSGGVINVVYEADDYAYVQDKRAMRMFKIAGFGRWSLTAKTRYIVERDKLYEKSNGREHNQTDIVIFELGDTLPVSDVGRRTLIDEYLSNVETIQVTVNLNITEGNYEYVKTYVKPATNIFQGKDEIVCGVMPDGIRGYVQIEKEKIRDPKKEKKKNRMVNPIAMAGWEYARLNLQYLVNPNSDRTRNETGISPDLASSLLGFFNELGTIVAGPNRILMERGFCQTANFEKSWIRLNDPNKDKIGGGHRVKQITMNDSWESINSEDSDAFDSQYGQAYEYTRDEESKSQGIRTISSGVASYEPFIGRDENPFVQPVPYDQKRPGVPDNRFTFEKPIGESFFPGASIGYSKIKVKSIEHEGQSKQHRTGYQVSEFFTYKDYPVVTQATIPETKFSNEGFQFTSNLFDNKTFASATQGFIIKLNDMHGKPKANWSYNEYDAMLSGVEYVYKQDAKGNLKNDVLAVDRFGDIDTKTFGVNVDFTMDSRFMKDESFNADADINGDAFIAGTLPLFIFSIWPQVEYSSTLVRTSTILKVIQRKGLLEKTIAYKEGSQIATENLLYDGATGDVLLTSVDNEFGNKVYSFNYPAHWAYDEGMGQAFVNWGLEVQGLSMSGGILASTNGANDLDEMLYPGDICRLNRPGKFEDKKVWVNRSTNDNLILIDQEGIVMYDGLDATKDNATTLRVLHSGRKNMAGVSIGSVTCLENPIKNVSGNLILDFKEVLATSAVEYKDEWRTDLSLFARYDCDTVGTDALDLYLNEIDSMISYSEFSSSPTTILYNLNYHEEICDRPFKFDKVSGFCIFRDTVSAISNGTSYNTVAIGARSSDYSKNRTRIYEDITNKSFPILRESSGINKKLIDQTSSEIIIQQYIPSSPIGSHPIWKGTNNSTGRLNIAGVWNSGNVTLPTNKWIGFSRCIDITSAQSYLIGIGGDNQVRVILNGDTIIHLNYEDHRNFNTWNVFPIELSPGNNIIQLEGLNVTNIAGFAAEIYNASISELENITTEQGLDSVLVFSTKNMYGQQFQVGDSASKAGYRCPNGYDLDYCDGSPKCVSSDSVYKGFFNCSVTLSTQNYPTKDIIEILDNSPIDLQTASLTARVKNEFNEIDTIDLVLHSECDTLYQCETICKLEEHARTVNPFVTGMRGNWRPYKSWTYVDDRKYDATRPNPAEDGAFNTYANFWVDDNVEGRFSPSYNVDQWVWTSEVTEYSPFGMELENMDPLGRYSAAIYGYANTLPTAVASNTRHRELWYEGFEEYTYLNTLKDEFVCPQWQNSYSKDGLVYAMYEEETNPNLDDSVSHTGNVSLKLEADDSLVQEIPLTVPFVPYSSLVLDGQYITEANDQIIPFRPTSGQYVVGLWVKENMSSSDTAFNNSFVKLEFEDGVGNITVQEVRPSGLIIEGWQRIEAIVDVPGSAEKLTLKYMSETGTSWFDDLRIFPYNGSMKSYSYDFRTLRLMAELDENNYATFYEYDLEGNLVRIKKETERGIKTLQESRQHQKAN